MKVIKVIVISVIITALIAALIGIVVYNKFIFAVLDITDAESFRNVVVSQEIVKSLQQSSTDNSDTETGMGEQSGVLTPEADIIETVTPGDNDSSEVENELSKGTVIYEDGYVKVTYIKQELSIFGPTVKFLIESECSNVIDVSFTDVHVDGYMADLCGIFVSELKPGKKAFETLYLYESNYENFTSFPSMVEFTIKVQDSESWMDLSESQTIYIDVLQ
jgi:hypothetical protein